MPSFEKYAPFDEVEYDHIDWADIMQYQQIPGIVRDIGDEFYIDAPGGGMTVTVGSGECLVGGFWAKNDAPKNLTIPTAHASLGRKDLVVIRLDKTAETITLEVKTGTPASNPVAPEPTVNSTIHEITVGIVDVPANDTNITSTQVMRARQWGGDTFPTVVDDFLLYGDKISSCSRWQCNGNVPIMNARTSCVAMKCPITTTVSQMRMCVTRARVGGATNMRLYYGPNIRELNHYVPITGYSTTSTGLQVGTFTPLTVYEHQWLVVAQEGVPNITTEPWNLGMDLFGNGATSASSSSRVSGSVWRLINPDDRYRATWANASFPETMDLTEAWTIRGDFPWIALA